MEYKDLHVDRGPSYDSSLSASAFDSYLSEWETRHIKEIVLSEFANGVPRYLDFACGTGRITQVIGSHATEVVGIDVSKSMLDVARQKMPRASFLELDLTSESPALGSFDLVSSFRFFGNAEPGLRTSVLRALNRVVKDKGLLLVNNHRNPLALLSLITQRGSAPTSMDLTHRHFRDILRTAGFEIVRSRSIAVWQFRSSLAATAGGHPRREAFLEWLMSSGLWATIAPDTVILARKIKTLA